ncbi:Sensor histidine kinase [Pseudomonas amygdali pv. tabaci]|uniref:Sensor histidine kinase n=4 Tax=Pseudomonas syringae group TaxID=136849 RepID=A0A3M6H734_PSEAJ|nr:Sensor histidine kinase [Pseudomonas amygdali pv. tabaci]
MIRSLRLRLMLGAATLAVIFMLLMLPALQGAFSLALRGAIEQRLASDVTTMISAARVEDGHLLMPSVLPGEQFNLPGSRLLGYIYNRQGQMV